MAGRTFNAADILVEQLEMELDKTPWNAEKVAEHIALAGNVSLLVNEILLRVNLIDEAREYLSS